MSIRINDLGEIIREDEVKNTSSPRQPSGGGKFNGWWIVLLLILLFVVFIKRYNDNNSINNNDSTIPTASTASTRVEEKPIPIYPDEEKIKSDLLGKKMPYWNFDYLSEFQDFRITKEEISNNCLFQTAVIKLKSGSNGKQYVSEIVIKYFNGNSGWEFSSVTQNSYSEIVDTLSTSKYTQPQISKTYKDNDYSKSQVDESNNNNSTTPTRVEEKPIPIYPDEEKIKSDLLGKKMPYWNFDYLSEFQDFRITKEEISNNCLFQTAVIKLKDGNNGKQYVSEIVIKYFNGNSGWEFSSIRQKSYSEIVKTQSTTNNFPSNQTNNDRSIKVIRDLVIGDYIYGLNTKVLGQILGNCIIRENVYFELDGMISGRVVLNKNATLIVNGILIGNVYNYGGKIIQHNHIKGRIINY